MYALPIDENVNVTGQPLSLGQQGHHPAWSPDNEALVYVYDKEDRSFLMAGSPNAWGVAPQAYATDGRLSSPSWSAVTLPLDLLNHWQSINGDAPDTPLYVESLAQPKQVQVEEGTPTPTPAPDVLLYEMRVNAPSPYLSDQVDQSFSGTAPTSCTRSGLGFPGPA